jgi:uncharacterized protein YndB with AHSA1/START domain
MKDFSITVQIDASPVRVWTVLSDIERWHEWTPTVTATRRTNAGPLRIGARARMHQPRLPPADWIVTALQEGRSFDWTCRRPGFRALAQHTIEPTESGSRVTLHLQFGGLFGGLVGWITGSLNRRYLALEADGLKRRAEAHFADV